MTAGVALRGFSDLPVGDLSTPDSAASNERHHSQRAAVATTLKQSNGAGFYRWDTAEGHLVMTGRQNGAPNLARTLRVRAGEGIGGRAFAERRVCWTDDWMADASLTYSADNAAAMVKSASARAFIAAPVILRDGVYGCS